MPHLCIVVARFYEDIADELSRGAAASLDASGATYDFVPVPGAFEIPAAVRIAIASGRYQGYVALGCVIRGETTHYDYVCAESARGLNHLAMEHMAAIGYGILTVENREQAFVRAATTQGNKGRDAAEAALHMLALKKEMGAQ
jgi:6,7-dimethyl-8-ribityllumazine synthase